MSNYFIDHLRANNLWENGSLFFMLKSDKCDFFPFTVKVHVRSYLYQAVWYNFVAKVRFDKFEIVFKLGKQNEQIWILVIDIILLFAIKGMEYMYCLVNKIFIGLHAFINPCKSHNEWGNIKGNVSRFLHRQDFLIFK